MRNKAFTLIELLVVVAIIGILAAVGVVAYNGYTGAAKVNVINNFLKLFIRNIFIRVLKLLFDTKSNSKNHLSLLVPLGPKTLMLTQLLKLTWC